MTGVVFCQTDELMDRATREYLRGDYLGAIQDFERVLELDENEKARRLLYKSLVEEGKRRFINNQFEESKKYLFRALEINPGDPEVMDLISQADAKLGVKPEKKPEPRDDRLYDLQKQIERERAAKNSYRSKLNSLASQRDKLRAKLKINEDKLKTAQENIQGLEEAAKKKKWPFTLVGILGAAAALAVAVIIIINLRNVYYSSSESRYQMEDLETKISERLKDADKESGELEERVARSINKMIDGQKDMVKQISVSSAGQTRDDIEHIKAKLDDYFEQQQNRLLDLMAQQVKALSSETTEKIELKGEGGRTVITDINPHVRARADGVEMIPKTISDPTVAEKMLRPYLSDPNNRVRANACVAIHRYNPEIAIDALTRMSGSPDKWMRLSAAWAVGEIGTVEVIPIIRKLLDDIEERVKDKAVGSFEKMAEVSEDVGEEIRKIIEDQKKRPDESQ
jgi:tetratricopeptide (TPR) repeat protein